MGGGKFCLFMQGATSWEWQVGRLGGHLRLPRFWVLCGVFTFYWCNRDGHIVRSWRIGPILFKRSRKTWAYARLYGASKRGALRAVFKTWTS